MKVNYMFFFTNRCLREIVIPNLIRNHGVLMNTFETSETYE